MAQPPPHSFAFHPGDFEEPDEENSGETERLVLEQSLFGAQGRAGAYCGSPKIPVNNQLVDLARVNAKEEARRQHNLDMETLLERTVARL